MFNFTTIQCPEKFKIEFPIAFNNPFPITQNGRKFILIAPLSFPLGWYFRSEFQLNMLKLNREYISLCLQSEGHAIPMDSPLLLSISRHVRFNGIYLHRYRGRNHRDFLYPGRIRRFSQREFIFVILWPTCLPHLSTNDFVCSQAFACFCLWPFCRMENEIAN